MSRLSSKIEKCKQTEAGEFRSNRRPPPWRYERSACGRGADPVLRPARAQGDRGQPPGQPLTRCRLGLCAIWFSSERTASPEASGGDSLAGMSAQPVHEHDPDDPVEILHVLPDRFREQFLAEYAAAAEAARQVEGYRALHDLLRRWRLTAAAYSEPGFEARLGGMREAVSTGSLDGSVPIEEIVPDWPARLNRR